MIRTIAKTTFDAHTDPIFQNLGILKFHDIYLIQLGLFMYSYQNHTLPLKFHCKFTLQSQIYSYNTRNSCKFRLPFCRPRTKQFSVFYQGPKFYNTLTLFRLGFFGQSVTGGGGLLGPPLCISGTNNARVMKFTHNDHLRTKKPHTLF